MTGKRPRDVLEVVLGHLELVRDDLPRLLDDLVGRLVERDAADGEAAAAVGVHPERDDGRVAVQHLDLVGVQPRRSATICENVVSWPWPCGEVPISACTVPVGRQRIVAASQPPAP